MSKKKEDLLARYCLDLSLIQRFEEPNEKRAIEIIDFFITRLIKISSLIHNESLLMINLTIKYLYHTWKSYETFECYKFVTFFL